MKRKKGVIVLIIIAGLTAAGVLFYSFFAPGIVLNIAQSSASSALGADVRIGDINFSIRNGLVEISDIAISNMEGFDAENIMIVERVKVSFSPLSFLSDTIKFGEIEVAGVDVFFQQKGRRNNLMVFQSGMPRVEKQEQENESGKSVSADIIKIEGIVLNLDIGGQGGSLRIDPIILENIDTAEGIGMKEVVARVTGAVMSGALRQFTGDIIPGGAGEAVKSAAEETEGTFRGILRDIGDLIPRR